MRTKIELIKTASTSAFSYINRNLLNYLELRITEINQIKYFEIKLLYFIVVRPFLKVST